jgi:hypothetical protein
MTHRPILAADSAISFERAKDWLNTCISEHNQCRKTIAGTEVNDTASRPLLPRRVISVGLEDTDAPRLLVSHEKAGRYIALSYCVRILCSFSRSHHFASICAWVHFIKLDFISHSINFQFLTLNLFLTESLICY